jgi:ATP-binding cassette subfamily B protein
VPVVIIPIVVLGRRLRALSRESQDWIAESSGNASEALFWRCRRCRPSPMNAPPPPASTRDREELRQRQETDRDAGAVMTIIVISLVFAGIVGVLWIGARDVRAEAMSVGELIQFLIYAIMVGGSVGALSEIWGELQRAVRRDGTAGGTSEHRGHREDPASGPPCPGRARGDRLRERRVPLSHTARKPGARRGELHHPPGRDRGAGRPVRRGEVDRLPAAPAVLRPGSGRITLDGVPLTEMSRDAFRRAMALVPQDPVIFAASARENIRFGRPDATDEEVEAAARAAAAHDFLKELPQGYDTYVGERGLMLSGGQKQRIAIARAILRDAPILLLDEATSALDAESERLVQDAVARLSEERTTLIVAHRLATVKQADRILVFEAGASWPKAPMTASWPRAAFTPVSPGCSSPRAWPPSDAAGARNAGARNAGARNAGACAMRRFSPCCPNPCPTRKTGRRGS